MNLHGIILAAHRAFNMNSSHLAKHEAKELIAQAVQVTPANDKFVAYFRDPNGKSYPIHLTCQDLVQHLDAKLKHCPDHRLIAVIPE